MYVYTGYVGIQGMCLFTKSQIWNALRGQPARQPGEFHPDCKEHLQKMFYKFHAGLLSIYKT